MDRLEIICGLVVMHIASFVAFPTLRSIMKKERRNNDFGCEFVRYLLSTLPIRFPLLSCNAPPSREVKLFIHPLGIEKMLCRHGVISTSIGGVSKQLASQEIF